jgi:hypothetical protein
MFEGGGEESGGDAGLLSRALEASGVKGEKLDKLTSALDAWKGGDDTLLKECAVTYESKDDPPGESDDGAAEEPTEEAPKKKLSDALDKRMFGGKAPPFGGK